MLALACGGCASTETSRLATDPFALSVMRKNFPTPDSATAVHVYLGGDGRPFLRPSVIARDPTARRSLALGLMAADPYPSIYLGRPCYHGHAQDSGCNFLLWTTHRYSSAVIDSMTNHLSNILGHRKAVLIGHSGGATIALLMSARLPNVTGVITVAGNLDVNGWVTHQGYSPLSGSLDPADQPPLPANLPQLHLVGAEDRTVPPRLTKQFAEVRQGSKVCEIPQTGHIKGWKERWPDLLERALVGRCPGDGAD